MAGMQGIEPCPTDLESVWSPWPHPFINWLNFFIPTVLKNLPYRDLCKSLQSILLGVLQYSPTSDLQYVTLHDTVFKTSFATLLTILLFL